MDHGNAIQPVRKLRPEPFERCWLVRVHGCKYVVNIGGEFKTGGFFTNRPVVAATSAEALELVLVEVSAGIEDLHDVVSKSPDSLMVARNVEPISRWHARRIPRSGHIFYHDGEGDAGGLEDEARRLEDRCSKPGFLVRLLEMITLSKA